ncbi:hypothetical protein SAMN05216226_1309 [Halovenus aranensis]|uniref:Uncharacterized protein n=1 Tax=Halovenus aranensis TaxID=890420 RepID=A0A1G8ZPN1_9EURY|nr:hypothetical protein SAMN05216226_1309 [Halovenus aranensis]
MIFNNSGVTISGIVNKFIKSLRDLSHPSSSDELVKCIIHLLFV